MGNDEVDEEDDIYNDDSAPGYAATRPVAKSRCCTCGDDVPFYDAARAPCGHEYCRGCLRELFTLSLTDETLFPPRCCREPIPADKDRFFLTSKLLAEFQARKVEMETPDRTYCHVPECSKFIAPDNIEHQIGKCVTCNARTCSVCKAAAHVGDCPEDPATKVLEGIAAENGWKRCGGCRRMVDLMSGCNHISKSMNIHTPPNRMGVAKQRPRSYIPQSLRRPLPTRTATQLSNCLPYYQSSIINLQSPASLPLWC